MTTYELNTYYCILYDASLADLVLTSLDGTVFEPLNKDEMMTIGKTIYYASLNTDDMQTVRFGFIAIEKMTICVNPEEEYSSLHVKLTPSEMVESEKKNAQSIAVLYKIYNAICTAFESKGICSAGISIGWHVINCAWDELANNNSESEESI